MQTAAIPVQYALLFSSLGILLMGVSFQWGSKSWLLGWLGANFILVGAAYGGLGARVLGKQSNGAIAPWALFLLFPFFSLTWSVWHLQRFASREPCACLIAPGIWLGRKAFAKELPDNISLLVDLTAEFPEPPRAILGKTYLCLPTLDASVPSPEAFLHLVQIIAAWQGNVYIHCALGRGRSATVAAAVLIEKGIIRDWQNAERYLQEIRPSVRLNRVQRHFLAHL
ncbi:dual specificity protein phosphatase family protein [Lusitaniella coriacea LEGE 07157]|uniref:Dual specificity protein phosphatase family protein n=1 Tax=Lusitaniella coriacea LEGE 07157 TaxID=945747 RepID=A0A8J7E004_9CYAN|nr:dual specificity protein phosphatase family protein [Lusitaniella coriacea]MBE9117961.1 dual specificity protein phosphatase family protein [Lusitaniella coriacea LEGE 07157]